jgi:hypothetical protein
MEGGQAVINVIIGATTTPTGGTKTTAYSGKCVSGTLNKGGAIVTGVAAGDFLPTSAALADFGDPICAGY